MVPGLGTRKLGLLIEIFRTPEAIFGASRPELEAAGMAPGVAQSIASVCAFEDAVEQQNKLTESGAILVTITGAAYPPRLREIYDPPPILFARGRLELLSTLMIGVVGTRRPTAYGTTVAGRLAHDLAGAGLTIVSGMARGIDTPRIGRFSTLAAIRSPFSAAESTRSIPRKTASYPKRSPTGASPFRSSPWARPPILKTFRSGTASSAA